MKRQPTVAEAILFVSGAVMLVFSFFSFWDYGVGTKNAWSSSFPLTTYASLFGGAIAVLIALTIFAGTKLPDQVLGFSWKQLFFMASVFSFLLMLAFLIGSDLPDLGVGGIFNFLGAIGLVVGSTMSLLGKGTDTVKLGNTKPTSGE